MAEHDKGQILEAVAELQKRLELKLYAEDPWGMAGGPLDEYASLATELISHLTRAAPSATADAIRAVFSEADNHLVSQIGEIWGDYAILHGINT